MRYGAGVRRAMHGHLWTLLPQLAHRVAPRPIPRDEPWEATFDDPERGSIRLTGWLRTRPGCRTLVVLLHGLGGSHDSRYVRSMACVCDAAGLPYLRFNMRGADRSGEDIYHAGTTTDLRVMLSSPPLAAYDTVYVIGFSLGGHILVRWATEADRDPRVRAIATVCAPLDLRYGAHAIQRPLGRPYQWHVLNGLKDMHRSAVRRGRLPALRGGVESIRTILEWDDRVVVPRFGFRSRSHYYESQSAGPRLAEMDLPTLFISAEADPVVTAAQVRPWLHGASDAVDVAWTEGGHIGFPHLLLRGRDVGPLEPQVLRWLLTRR